MKHSKREDKQNVAVTEESGVALHLYPAQYQSQYASPPRGMAGDFQPQGMARAPHPQDTGMGPQYPQDMTGMGTQYPQDMTGMGPQYPQAMTGMGPQYPQDMTGMGPQYPQDMTGMGTQYPQDMTGMGPQYPQDMTGMGTQYPQAMTSAPYSQAMVRDANQQQDIPNGNELVYTDSMIISIVSCLFCWIIGLFAISKARNLAKVLPRLLTLFLTYMVLEAREAFRHGDIARAVALSQTARKMAIAGIVLGLIIIVLNVMRSALDLF
ncbi:hypothetical protein RRG08_032923 [Elysia crispata]|uniref:Uncharacterized protein n=1 Tax=Elysia crispata TaxID=231223 RepID=A0AAE1A834_9GAST|nr:hypothetical protein RRG08_032923 [Elysia crispata]